MNDTKLAVLVAAATPGPYRAFLRAHDVPYFEAGRERVELPAALAGLFAAGGIISDAGGVLNGALLRARLVDEVDVQFLPAIVGQATAPAVFEGFGLGTPGVPAVLEHVSAEARPDGSIFARYTLHECPTSWRRPITESDMACTMLPALRSPERCSYVLSRVSLGSARRPVIC
jgi:riboflavin biosynthesis pyrimidine reductase